MAQLLQEVIEIRKRRNNELKNVKIYFNRVMEVWSRLKALRNSQGYLTTRLSLEVYSAQEMVYILLFKVCKTRF